MRKFFVALFLPFALHATAETISPRAALARIEVKPTEVLVLGTPHLSQIAEWSPAIVGRLNDALVAWRPTMIIIEQPAADEIEAGLREPHDREILEAFVPTAIKLGAQMQRHLGVDAASARRQAAELSASDGDENGARETAFLIASYDIPSAVVRWLGMSADGRAKFSATYGVSLDELASNRNELYSVAAAVAHRVGLRRLEGADNHLDDVELSRIDASELKPLMEHPLYKSTLDSPFYKRRNALQDDAVKAGDLLHYYRYLNSRESQEADMAAQWGLFLRTNLPSGVDRFRYMLWEARNQAITARVSELIARRRPDRVLVLFGAAHKPFLEAGLASSVMVRLVALDAILPPAPAAR